MKRQFDKKTNTMTVVDANEHETQFLLLKKEAKVLNTTDPDGFVYENVYSNESKLLKFKYPDGKTELYDYDTSGRLVKFTDRSSKELRFQYDEKGRIVSYCVVMLQSASKLGEELVLIFTFCRYYLLLKAQNVSDPSEQCSAAVQAAIRGQQRSQPALFGEVRRNLKCFVIRPIPHLTTSSLKTILSPVVAVIQIDLVIICN